MARTLNQEKPIVSIVIPVYNEKDNLEALWEELLSVLERLGEPFEVVFVDDGSSDGSAAILRDLHERDGRVRVVRLARNFSQQMAVTAGFHQARGEAIVLMDADLQTPPQHIPEFVAKLQAGYDVVYGKRERRVGRWYRRMGTVLANRFICSVTGFNIPDSASGFLGLNGRFVQQINRYNDRSRYLSGLFAWLSYGRYAVVPVERRERLHGESKYTFCQLVRLVITIATNFSTRPLALTGWMATASGIAALAVGTRGVVLCATGQWGLAATPLSAAWLMAVGTACLAGVAITGTYIGRIYSEVRERPPYVVWETIGIEANRGKTHFPESPSMARHAPSPAPGGPLHSSVEGDAEEAYRHDH